MPFEPPKTTMESLQGTEWEILINPNLWVQQDSDGLFMIDLIEDVYSNHGKMLWEEGRYLSKDQNAPIVAMCQIHKKKMNHDRCHYWYTCTASSSLVRKFSPCPCEALQHESHGPVGNLSHGPWEKVIGTRWVIYLLASIFLSKDHFRYAFQISCFTSALTALSKSFRKKT